MHICNVNLIIRVWAFLSYLSMCVGLGNWWKRFEEIWCIRKSNNNNNNSSSNNSLIVCFLTQRRKQQSVWNIIFSRFLFCWISIRFCSLLIWECGTGRSRCDNLVKLCSDAFNLLRSLIKFHLLNLWLVECIGELIIPELFRFE